MKMIFGNQNTWRGANVRTKIATEDISNATYVLEILFENLHENQYVYRG